MFIFRAFKKLFNHSEDDDLVVVDVKTKLIQSMSSREWCRLKNKQNYIIIK